MSDMARNPQPDDAPPEAFEKDRPQDEADEQGLPELTFEDEATAPAALQRGAAAIRAHWKHAPLGPGVYRMIGADGEVLYVGKAKSVKKRIASYMRGEGHTNRIARMIALTVSMIFVQTETETEALLLETNLIKQLKPRFNVLMRDDKSFPYILLTRDHAAPQIAKHRGARNRKGDYFGPFASAQAVHRTLNALQRAFLLRTCSDSYFENRTRPCLLFQIKRCSGPCTGEISTQDYATLVDEAHDFLSGKSRAVRDLLAREMNEAAEDLQFEKAARFRDRIAALSTIQGAQGINPRGVEEADVFAIAEQAGQFCIEVFFFRTGQNWGNRAYFPRADKSLSSSEVLDAFVAQFYSERPAPALVLLSEDVEDRALLDEALSARAGRKVEVLRPQRGEKRELVDQVRFNARETLSRKMAEAASQRKLLDALGEAFGVGRSIRRVEVYDNSHIAGTNAVGAMIVAGVNGFMKAHYRTFNIKSETLTPGDDFGMMREVLRRRFARLVREESTLAPASPDDRAQIDAEPEAQRDADAFPARPDLVIIDGGRGQFEAARAVLAELGVENVAIASIAKGADRDSGREQFFIDGREPFRLPPRDPALYFVQRLRDEAHRFAIGTHRARRKKDFVRSPLDEIAGVGPARKRALLQAFGTAKAVARASLADLEKTPGVNAATARLVYAHFNEKG
ncbi:MAG: excinuclease ABC subunit UvrC [Hyphomicrobiales bacterium]|nr:excinuclease ABC subunit UvrC [Hyphomicrobiales bacterium]